MKARFIREARALNPAFSNKAKRQAQKDGVQYDVDTYITIPVGFEEEGPHCWVHCCPGYKDDPPLCEPADDECRQRVAKWMNQERPKHLERIRQMALPENLKKLPKKQQAHVQDLADAYNLTGVTEPIKPTPIPKQDTNAVPEQGNKSESK